MIRNGMVQMRPRTVNSTPCPFDPRRTPLKSFLYGTSKLPNVYGNTAKNALRMTRAPSSTGSLLPVQYIKCSGTTARSVKNVTVLVKLS